MSKKWIYNIFDLFFFYSSQQLYIYIFFFLLNFKGGKLWYICSTQTCIAGSHETEEDEAVHLEHSE